MQLSVFEMVKKGVSTIIEVVDAFAREQINELNSSLNAKQNKTDNALTTTAKTIVGAINEHEADITQINSDLSKIKLEMSTKTQTYSITSTSQTAGYYYQFLPIPDGIDSINKIYGVMQITNSGIGALVSVNIDIPDNRIDVRYTQSPSATASITLKFLYNAN